MKITIFLIVCTFLFIGRSLHAQDEWSGTESGLSETMEWAYEVKHAKMDLNRATISDIEQIPALKPDLARAIIEHRHRYGNFVSLFELQAVEGLQKEDFEILRQFLKVDKGTSDLQRDHRSIWKRMQTNRSQYLLFRWSADSLQGSIGNSSRLLLKYKNTRTSDFALYIFSKKDAGELLKWMPSKKMYGLDFYGGSLTLFEKGAMPSWVIGDIKMQFGQGVLWAAGFMSGKSAEPSLGARQVPIRIQGNKSASENGFLRGFAVQKHFGRWELSCILGYEKFQSRQTSTGWTVQRNPYHRTESERMARGQNTAWVLGGMGEYVGKQLRTGLSFQHIYFQKFVASSEDLYKKNSFYGNHLSSLAVSAQYFYRDWIFYGESVLQDFGGRAGILGWQCMPSSNLEWGGVGRWYNDSFESYYGSSFGNSSPSKNEKGLYLYFAAKVHPKCRLTFYADWDLSPSFTFQEQGINTSNSEYLVRATWAFSKQTRLYIQGKIQTSPTSTAGDVVQQLYTKDAYSWQADIRGPFNEYLNGSMRIQGSFKQRGSDWEQGIAMAEEIYFSKNIWKLGIRWIQFETASWDSRQYMYERDVFLAFSIPAYDGIGSRVCGFIEWNPSKSWKWSLKYSRDQDWGGLSSGKGIEQRTEWKIQALWFPKR